MTAQRVLVGVAAVALLGPGLWAMMAPESFYSAVAMYPPYNPHFIHDIGAFMIGAGATLGFALVLSDVMLVALAGNAVGALAHAVSHVFDRDIGGQSTDPAFFSLFALLLIALAAWRWRTVSSGRP